MLLLFNLGICLETSSLEVAESALCSERKAVGILKALGQGLVIIREYEST